MRFLLSATRHATSLLTTDAPTVGWVGFSLHMALGGLRAGKNDSMAGITVSEISRQKAVPNAIKAPKSRMMLR